VLTIQAILLAAVPALYLWFVFQYFWTLPAPSDPMQYLDAAVWHSTYAYFPWVDRVMVAMGLQVFTTVFSAFPPYEAGMFYIAAVNASILVAGMSFAYFKRGFLAALITGLLLASSYTFLAYATYIYTDQTLAFWSLLALIFFSLKYRHRWLDPAVLAGFFGTLACFSKLIGIAVLAVMAGILIWKHDWPRLKRLAIGCGIAAFAVLLAVLVFFGPDSFANLFWGASRYYGQWAVNTRYGIVLSYFSMLSADLYLPLFLGALVFIGAYRDPLTRTFYLGALAFVTVLTLFIAFTRQVQAIPNYLYPAVTLCGVGAGLHLGGMISARSPAFPGWGQVLMGALAIALVFGTLKVGQTFRSAFMDPGAENVPGIARTLYALVPLAIVAGLVAIEVTRRPVAVLLVLLMVFAWMPAYAGAFAFNKAKLDRQEAAFFYEAAPALNQVPVKEFGIFLESWNNYNHADRVTWVYRSFFNQKYTRASQEAAEKEIESSIQFLSNSNRFGQLRSNYLLTDAPAKVLGSFPKAREIASFPWKDLTFRVYQLQP
jgi:hypothetical protein